MTNEAATETTWADELAHMALVQARPPDALYIASIQDRFGGLDLVAEAIAFRTSWTGRPRELSRLRDWRMAWLNWLKKTVAGTAPILALRNQRRGVADKAATITDEYLRNRRKRENERDWSMIARIDELAQKGLARPDEIALGERIASRLMIRDAARLAATEGDESR